jgi:hypothetical protein
VRRLNAARLVAACRRALQGETIMRASAVVRCVCRGPNRSRNQELSEHAGFLKHTLGQLTRASGSSPDSHANRDIMQCVAGVCGGDAAQRCLV